MGRVQSSVRADAGVGPDRLGDGDATGRGVESLTTLTMVLCMAYGRPRCAVAVASRGRTRSTSSGWLPDRPQRVDGEPPYRFRAVYAGVWEQGSVAVTQSAQDRDRCGGRAADLGHAGEGEPIRRFGSQRGEQ